MLIHVVLDDNQVLAVFTDPMKASTLANTKWGLSVQAVIVDCVDTTKPMLKYTVKISDDGTRYSLKPNKENKRYMNLKGDDNQWWKDIQYYESIDKQEGIRHGYCDCWAKDDDQALAIARARRQEYIACGMRESRIDYAKIEQDQAKANVKLFNDLCSKLLSEILL